MTELTINPSTGLPDLGTGYFWRIVDATSVWSTPRIAVQLHRRTWWPHLSDVPNVRRRISRSVVVSYDVIYIYDSYTTERALSEISATAASQARDVLEKNVGRDIIQAFVGDYPPKTLNPSTLLGVVTPKE